MIDEVCRSCGCTQDDCSQCIDKTGVPCYWVEENLCSACVGDVKAIVVQCYFKDGTGNRQAMSFETELTVGCDEELQLNQICMATLKDNGFLKTSNHKISYKFLHDI